MDTPRYSRELRAALQREAAPDLNHDLTDVDVTADATETIAGVPVVTDPSLEFDAAAHAERNVLGTLRRDAGRHYDTDGFSTRTLREIIRDLEADGYEPGGIIVADVDAFDGERVTAYEGEQTAVADVNFHGWPTADPDTADVLTREAIIFGADAVTRPHYAPAHVLVRHPDGVAHWEY